MKALILILSLASLASCSMIRPEYLMQMANTGDAPGRSPATPAKYNQTWGLDKTNKAVMDKFWADKRECEDIAFKAVAIGSRFGEFDIALGCMERRGYKLKTVAAK